MADFGGLGGGAREPSRCGMTDTRIILAMIAWNVLLCVAVLARGGAW